MTGGEQANITSRGVMLFWTGVKTSSGEAASADYYYLWYKCDDKETLINVTSATHNHLVDDVGKLSSLLSHETDRYIRIVKPIISNICH